MVAGGSDVGGSFDVGGSGFFEVVAVFGPSSPDYVATFYGLTSTGAVITSLNVMHNVAELSYQLRDSGARVLILLSEPTPALLAATRKAGVTRVLRLDDVRHAGRSGNEPEPPPAPFDAASEVASVTYTQAPSDVPMGVMVTHRNLVSNVLQTQAVDPLAHSEVVVGLMPFCQLYGMVAVNVGLHVARMLFMFVPGSAEMETFFTEIGTEAKAGEAPAPLTAEQRQMIVDLAPKHGLRLAPKP